MKTVLIFVMGSDASPYPQLMRGSRETWDSANVEGVPTRYFSNTLKDRPERTIQFDVAGGLYDMGYKCLKAYRWALDNLSWDYMARVNASCYVRKQPLLNHVQTLPDYRLFRGVKTNTTRAVPFLWGGCQFIMSRDVIQAFVDHGEQWDHSQMEDVAMSILAPKFGIPLDGDGMACSINKTADGWSCIAYGTDGFDFTTFDEFREKIGNQFFIRVKQDMKRDVDVWIMRELLRVGV